MRIMQPIAPAFLTNADILASRRAADGNNFMTQKTY